MDTITPGTPAPGRPRDDTREQAILEAALAVLAEVGYDRLTMDAVAARAKASKATIYRRWAGKSQLIIDAMHHYAGEAPDEVDTGTLRGDLLVLVDEVCTKIGGFDGRLFLGLAQATLSDRTFCQMLHEQMSDDKHRLPHTVVQRAIARGELPPGADATLFNEITPAITVLRLIAGQSFDDGFKHHVVDDLLIPALQHPPAFPQHQQLFCGAPPADESDGGAAS